jgi:hypothetical protein
MMEFARSKRNFPYVLKDMADKAAVVLIRLLARSAEERDVATHLILLLATLPGPPCAFMDYLNEHQHWPSVRQVPDPPRLSQHRGAVSTRTP